MKPYLLAAILLLIATTAHADAPYLMKQGLLDGPDAVRVIKEFRSNSNFLFGRSIIFQLRLQNGAVVAQSPAIIGVATFCPSIEYCWAFPYDSFTVFPQGWRLEADKLDFAAIAPEYRLSQIEDKEFQKYLLDDERLYFVTYSMRDKYDIPFNFVLSKFGYLFGPFLIIFDQELFLVLTIILIVIPIITYCAISNFFYYRKYRVYYIIVSSIVYLIFVLLYMTVFSYFVMIQDFPVLYAFVLFMLALSVDFYILRRFGRNRILSATHE